jgi:hypothetical protein
VIGGVAIVVAWVAAGLAVLRVGWVAWVAAGVALLLTGGVAWALIAARALGGAVVYRPTFGRKRGVR